MESLTAEQQRQLRSLFDKGLVGGIGSRDQTCIEGALCLVLYGVLSDEHRGASDCRSEDIVRASIHLNDGPWSSNAARSAGLWDLALAQIGSAKLDQTKIVKRYVELTIRKILPIALRKIGLNAEAERCERDGDEAAANAAYAAYAAWAANAAYSAYAANAAYSANAAYAATAASYASLAAASADADAADRILSLSASLLVQAINEARQ